MDGHIVAAIALPIAIWIVVAFNRLVRARNLVAEGWSDIDVQLKRRHTLVPGLVECVRGYARHEMTALESVTRLRAQTGVEVAPRDRLTGENELTDQLKELFAVVERYPDLKANRSFLTLQMQLVEIEEQIQYSRRFYNGAVRDYNIRAESFPGIIVARLFAFRPAAFFEIQVVSERSAPGVSFGDGTLKPT